MVSAHELKKSLANLKSSLPHESILGEQSECLYIAGCGAARELRSVCCSETERLLNELTTSLNLEAVNYHKLGACVHLLKGGSSRSENFGTTVESLILNLRCQTIKFCFCNYYSIGTTRIVCTCMGFSDHCKAVNDEGCVIHLQRLKDEYQILKAKLENIQKLEDDIISAGGSIE